MQRLPNIGKSLVDSGGSTVDGNRLYSILLDARASKVSENMFDVADSLLGNEKDNAKTALEQLWSLKRNLQPENDTGTVDLLIRFYQDKLNVLRNKEENIKRISKDSRSLLEEKRKRDCEIATVKQEISDCKGEVERLNLKLNKLNIKEQELTLVEMQVKKELQINANEIVNGLYEIILSQQSIDGGFIPEEPSRTGSEEADRGPAPDIQGPESAQESRGGIDVLDEKKSEAAGGTTDDTDVVVLKRIETPAPPLFPKSVVKTTRGTVIGEYYYDPRVYKLDRHYIFNSDFLRDQLTIAVRKLREDFDQARYAEAVQMVQDALKRIESTPNLHFEVSTNEILNARTLKELHVAMRSRAYDDVLKVCGKLGAKIAALGNNYRELLREQMIRLVGPAKS